MALTITATLTPVGPATALKLSDDQVEQLGGGKRAAVVVTIGDRRARLRLAPMGGENLIGLSKATRADLGVAIGDDVTATVELDTAERIVDVPDDLAAALDAGGLRAAFDALAPSKRKEAARSVVEAKRAETRQRRIDAVVDSLR